MKGERMKAERYELQREILKFTREREKLEVQLESPLCKDYARTATLRKIAEVNTAISRLEQSQSGDFR
jgi:hypothetical protein